MTWTKGEFNCSAGYQVRREQGYISPKKLFGVCFICPREEGKKEWVIIHLRTGAAMYEFHQKTLRDSKRLVDVLEERPSLWEFGEFAQSNLTDRQKDIRKRRIKRVLENIQ